MTHKRYSVNLLREQTRIGKAKRFFLKGFLAVLTVASIAAAFVSGPATAIAMFVLGNSVGFAVEPGQFSRMLGFAPPRTVNYITGMQGVAASSVGTLNIPVNRRYHSLRIRTTNTAGALVDPVVNISNVQLSVNGAVILNCSPASLINTAKTYRITPGTGEIPIFFTEPWRNDTRTAEATSWDMFGQNTFVLQLTFLAPGAGVAIQAVQADFDYQRNARRDRKTGQMVPFLAILKKFDMNVNSPAGASDVTNIPTNYPIQRLYLDVSASSIADVTVYGDNNTKVFEATKLQNQDLLNANLITGTFFEFPIIFDYDSKLGSNLQTQSIDVKVNSVAANTTTFHVVQLVPGYV